MNKEIKIEEIEITEKNLSELKERGITSTDKIKGYDALVAYAVLSNRKIRFRVYAYPLGNMNDKVAHIEEPTQLNIL